jgi:hypothetical protein
MNQRACAALFSTSAALILSLAARSTRADATKDQCVDANGKGQELRREGKLAAAKEQLRICANPACPTMVRDDCTKRLDDLEKAQPTIAFEVKDASGADVSAVRVKVDGKPLAERLDGTALPVDIGEHAFTFEVAGHPPVTRSLVLTEGEKGRRERVAIGTATQSTAPAPPQARSPGPVPTPEVSAPSSAAPVSFANEPASTGGGMGTQKVLGLVAGGVGVTGVVVGAVFGLTSKAKHDDASVVCPGGRCTDQNGVDRWSDARAAGNVSTAAFVVGGVGLAAATVLWFTARPAAAEHLARHLEIGPRTVALKGEW